MSKTGTDVELNYRVKEKISKKEKVSYGLGALADGLIWSSVGAFGTFYYTNSVGLAAAAVGTMFLLSRVMDGFSDILMGLIIDRTKSKHGKARPWILWMAIPYALAAVLLFSVPQSFSMTAKLIYAFITYNLVSTVAYTAIIQPYATLSSLITDNVKDRTHINLARMGFAMFTAVLVNFLVLPLVTAFGDTPVAWTKTFAIIGVVSAIIFVITFKNTKERLGVANEVEEDKKDNNIPVKTAIKSLLKNKYWVNRVFYGVSVTIATAITGANIYFTTYWLNNPDLLGYLALVNVVPMIISLFLVTSFALKYGKRNTTQIGLVIIVIGLLFQLIAPSNATLVLLGHGIRGFGTGLATTIIGVMLGDTIDFGEWKNKFRTEGLIFSAANIGSKVGSGLGLAMLGWFLAWGGFNAALLEQSTKTMSAIFIVFIIVPLIVTIFAILLNVFYDLDKKMPMILNELNERAEKSKSVETETVL